MIKLLEGKMKTIIIIVVYLIIVGTWIIWELKHAPQGFQDDKGYHESADDKEKKEKANVHSTTTSV
jgi:hypothetical protein